MACSSGCPTQDHESWGACVRAKHLSLSGLESMGGNRTLDKKQDKELSAYRDARKAGVQPATTKLPDIQKAMSTNG